MWVFVVELDLIAALNPIGYGCCRSTSKDTSLCTANCVVAYYNQCLLQTPRSSFIKRSAVRCFNRVFLWQFNKKAFAASIEIITYVWILTYRCFDYKYPAKQSSKSFCAPSIHFQSCFSIVPHVWWKFPRISEEHAESSEHDGRSEWYLRLGSSKCALLWLVLRGRYHARASGRATFYDRPPGISMVYSIQHYLSRQWHLCILDEYSICKVLHQRDPTVCAQIWRSQDGVCSKMVFKVRKATRKTGTRAPGIFIWKSKMVVRQRFCTPGNIAFINHHLFVFI